MAYRSGKARISSVGGVFGLKVEIVGDVQTANALAKLPAAVQRKVARLAIAAKARPIQNAMKLGARRASASSRRQEGIGATARSIATKVETSKKNPWVTYARIGARRGYYEFIHLQDDQKRSGVSHVTTITRKRRGSGRKAVYEDRGGRLKTLSARGRKARLSPNRHKDGTHGGAIKRGPSRYLHLIETGGRKGRLRAYRFMDQAARTGHAAGQTAYIQKMDDGIRREFAKLAAK